MQTSYYMYNNPPPHFEYNYSCTQLSHTTKRATVTVNMKYKLCKPHDQ